MSHSRKVTKAVYLLIEKYHRLTGLEVYGFSHGGFGPGYYGFQLAANRCFWGDDLRSANYSYDASPGDYGPLVSYWERPAVPAWAAGEQLELLGWESMRTAQIVEWLEHTLALDQLISANASLLGRWRARYTVEQSEQYLLMINVAGLLSARRGSMPLTPSQTFSDYDNEGSAKARSITRKLGLECEASSIFGVSEVFVGRNGLALTHGTLVDVWREFTSGAAVDEIVDRLLAPAGGSGR